MLDQSETTVYGARAWPGDRREKRIVVSIRDRGYELLLFFADLSGDGPVLELRLLPGDQPLEPRVLRQFAPHSELYVTLARATIKWKREDVRGALAALREIGGPGRGLSDEFYRQVAQGYAALVAEGEPHPVKALGEIHHVTISAASRWIKEARRRDLIPEEGSSDAR